MSTRSGSLPVCAHHGTSSPSSGRRTIRHASDCADFGISPLARCHQLRGSSSPCVHNLLVPTPECLHSERRIHTLRESPLHRFSYHLPYPTHDVKPTRLRSVNILMRLLLICPHGRTVLCPVELMGEGKGIPGSARKSRAAEHKPPPSPLFFPPPSPGL